MKTTFTARHFSSSPKLQEYCMQSITKMDQFFDNIISCDIVLEPTKDHDNPAKAELNIRVPKETLVVSESAPSYEQAIDNAVDNLVRQIRKYKSKRFEH